VKEILKNLGLFLVCIVFLCYQSSAFHINLPPIVNAGVDQLIYYDTPVYLDGTVIDAEGPIVSTIWSKVSGPGAVFFSNPTTIDTFATFSSAGTYVLRLTASDGTLSSSDDVNILVQANPNQPKFIRGDANNSKVVDITDVILIAEAAAGQRELSCEKSADTNDDGQITDQDSKLLANYLFKGGPKPASPFPIEGTDPTPDFLTCKK